MWVKALKWLALVGLALGMVYGVYSLGEHAGSSRVQADWNKSQAEQSKKVTRLEREAREREQRHAEEVSTITDTLYARLNHATEERDSIIADLHNDNRQLRERFRPRKCPTVETASGQPGSDEADTGGLSHPDEEFLIRIASEADTVVHRLTACQTILKTEREVRTDGE